MFVVADQWLANVVVGKELLSVAGILAGDLVYFLEDTKGRRVMSSRLPMGVPTR